MKRRPPPTVDPGFVEFVAARSAALFRTAVLIVGDRHAAEDLVQGALERAYRHWDRVAGMDAPEAYVRRILANLATDHHRRRGRGAVALPWPPTTSSPPTPTTTFPLATRTTTWTTTTPS